VASGGLATLSFVISQRFDLKKKKVRKKKRKKEKEVNDKKKRNKVIRVQMNGWIEI
jgi:hypothetical protein